MESSMKDSFNKSDVLGNGALGAEDGSADGA